MPINPSSNHNASKMKPPVQVLEVIMHKETHAGLSNVKKTVGHHGGGDARWKARG
jgi:hypothetical protein